MPQDNSIPYANLNTMTEEDMAVRESEDQVIQALNGSVDTPLAQLSTITAQQEDSMPIGMRTTEELQQPFDLMDSANQPSEENLYQLGSDIDQIGMWLLENKDIAGTPDFNMVADEWERLDALAQDTKDVINANDVTAAATKESFEELFGQLSQASPQDSGKLKDFVRSAAGGVLKAGAGLDQMILEGAEYIGVPGAKGLNERFTDFSGKAFEEVDRRGSDNPLTSAVGDIGGQVSAVAFSPISGGRTLLPKFNANLADFSLKLRNSGQIAKQATDLAALETILFKDAEDESTRAEDAYAGGKLGAAVTVALGSAGAVGSKIGRSEAAKMVTKEIGDLSTKFNVPTTLGEIRNSRGIQVVESILDQVPVIGMSGFRNQQLVALRDAADNMVRSIGGVVDDVGTTLQASLRKVLTKNKAASGKEYDAITRRMGDGIVPMTYTKTEGEAVLKNLQSNRDLLGKNAAEDTAQRVVDATTEAPIMSEVVDRLGNYIQIGIKPGAEKTWGQLREYRSELGKTITQAQNAVKNGTGTFAEVKALTQLKKAVEKDLEAAALAAGDDVFAMWKKADANYKSKVIPFQKGALKRSLTEGIDTDTILASFVKQDKAFGTGTARAQQLFANTEKGGQQAVKYSVLQDAWTNASKGGEFNAKQFIGQLQKTSAARKVVFDKAEQDSLNGFIKLVNSIPRAQAGQTIGMNAQARRILSGGGVNRGGTSATGFGTAAAGAAGLGSLTSFSTAIPIVGGVKGVSMLLTTQKGRSILARYPKSMPSQREQFVKEANSEIAAVTRKMMERVTLED